MTDPNYQEIRINRTDVANGDMIIKLDGVEYARINGREVINIDITGVQTVTIEKVPA